MLLIDEIHWRRSHSSFTAFGIEMIWTNQFVGKHWQDNVNDAIWLRFRFWWIIRLSASGIAIGVAKSWSAPKFPTPTLNGALDYVENFPSGLENFQVGMLPKGIALIAKQHGRRKPFLFFSSSNRRVLWLDYHRIITLLLPLLSSIPTKSLLYAAEGENKTSYPQ